MNNVNYVNNVNIQEEEENIEVYIKSINLKRIINSYFLENFENMMQVCNCSIFNLLSVKVLMVILIIIVLEFNQIAKHF